MALPIGCVRLIVSGALDAAAYPIVRLNAADISLNNAVALAVSAGFAFEYVVCGDDCKTGGSANVGMTVGFSASGNILHLIVAYAFR